MISVVIPSYQQGRFIERTLRSVLDQEQDDVELFVCDGGSTDETAEILRRYDDRIRWVSEPDRGQSHAVNKAIARTSGEIIAWLNSDDVYRPGSLARVAACFRERPSMMALYGDADYIDADDRVQGTYPTRAWDLTALRDSCYLAQPATFFRRRLVERFGGLDERLHYCMDYELWLRYGEQTDFVYLPVVLAACRMYKGTKTVSGRIPHLTEINTMLRERFPAVPDGWLRAFAIVWAEARFGPERGEPGCETRRAGAALRAAAMASARWKTPLSAELRDWLLAHRVATVQDAS
jgi:glycosyltransferase involved in cell wall biosynthesis